MSHTIADKLKLTNDIGESATIKVMIVKIRFYVENKLLNHL